MVKLKLTGEAGATHCPPPALEGARKQQRRTGREEGRRARLLRVSRSGYYNLGGTSQRRPFTGTGAPSGR